MRFEKCTPFPKKLGVITIWNLFKKTSLSTLMVLVDQLLSFRAQFTIYTNNTIKLAACMPVFELVIDFLFNVQHHKNSQVLRVNVVRMVSCYFKG